MFHHGTTLARPAPTVRRRTLLGATGLVAAAPALAACTGGRADPPPRQPPAKVTFLTGAGLNPLGSFPFTAQAKGYFAEVSLEVEVQPGSAADNHQLLASGQADFAHVDGAAAYIRYTQGGDTGFRIVAAVQQRTINSLVALASSGIERPTDLEGRTIGVVRGSVPEIVFPAYAELAGIDASSVRFEYSDFPGLIGLLVGRQVDAAGLFVPTAPGVEAAAGEPVTVLPYDEFITGLYGTVIVASADLVERDPDLVRRFTGALMRGLEYTVDNPEEAGRILHEAAPANDPAASAAQIALMQPYVLPSDPSAPVGVMDSGRVAQGIALLQSLGLVPLSSNLAAEQDIIAWEIVPGAEES
jgi:NitT/TauT family transport system substrate-binding protein